MARQKSSFRSFNFRNEGEQFTSLKPQKIQHCRKGKIEFRKPNNPRLDKIERRVQNFRKFGKKVAAATQSLMESQLTHVEAIFRLPINRRRRL